MLPDSLKASGFLGRKAPRMPQRNALVHQNPSWSNQRRSLKEAHATNTSPSSSPRVHSTSLNLLSLLSHLPLPPLLGSFGPRFGIHHVVPPSETARIIANELFMMNVMKVGTAPKREELVQTPRQVVPAMGIDSLKQSEGDPYVYGKDMKVTRDGTPEDWRSNGWNSKKHDLDGRSIFSS